ncbi:MAG: hypothetical protein ABSE49_27625, partial [Polyangiaceae bacterium]
MRISRGGWVAAGLLAAAAACSHGDDTSFSGLDEEGGAPHYNGAGDDAATPDDSGHGGGGEGAASGDDATAEASSGGAMEASTPQDTGGNPTAVEAGEEASVEAGAEASAEAAAPEAGEEAGTGAGPDAGHEASVEAGAPEASIEAGAPEASVEAAAPEASVEAGPDATAEATVDAGVDAPPETSTVEDTGVAESAPPYVAPVCDGVISPGEYGGAANQATDLSGQTWYMTWDDNNIYVAITNADVLEGNIVYFSNGGPGMTSGELYDSTDVTTLPFSAQLAVYAHDGYTEGRQFSGGAWGTPNTTLVRLCDNATTQVREEVIPWSLFGGKPVSFGWTGYLAADGNTNPNGYIYGQMPLGNPS